MILSVDPGNYCGWATVTGDKVHYFGALDIPKGGKEAIDAIDLIVHKADMAGVDTLVMEAQRPGAMGAKQLQKLYFNRHLWEFCALSIGWELAEPMPPATWQAHWKLTAERAGTEEKWLTARINNLKALKGKTGDLPRDRNKLKRARQRRFQDAIIKMASAVMGEPVPENAADALLQGLAFEAGAGR